MPTGRGHRAKPPPGSVADCKVSYQWCGGGVWEGGSLRSVVQTEDQLAQRHGRGLVQDVLPRRLHCPPRPAEARERRVALLTTRPLALQDRIAPRDRRDKPFVADAAESRWCGGYWLAIDGCDGRPFRGGAVTGRSGERPGAAADGRSTAPASTSAARLHTRPNVAYRPVSGGGPRRRRGRSGRSSAAPLRLSGASSGGAGAPSPTRPDSAVRRLLARFYRASLANSHRRETDP